MRLRVIKLEETPLQLICKNKQGAKVTVDPFVTCAWGRDEGLESVGQEIVIASDTYQHPGGEFLPDISEISITKSLGI